MENFLNMKKFAIVKFKRIFKSLTYNRSPLNFEFSSL